MTLIICNVQISVVITLKIWFIYIIVNNLNNNKRINKCYDINR